MTRRSDKKMREASHESMVDDMIRRGVLVDGRQFVAKLQQSDDRYVGTRWAVYYGETVWTNIGLPDQAAAERLALEYNHAVSRVYERIKNA